MISSMMMDATTDVRLKRIPTSTAVFGAKWISQMVRLLLNLAMPQFAQTSYRFAER